MPAVLVQPVPCQGGTVRGWWLVWVLCHMNRAMRPWLWGPCAGTHGRGGSLGLFFSLGHQGASPRCPPGLCRNVPALGRKQLLGIGLGSGLGGSSPLFSTSTEGSWGRAVKGNVAGASLAQ